MTKPNSAAGSTSFLVAAIGIYVAYFLHGASVIALAQNMSALAEKFATDSAGIAYLISGIGLGRLVTILFFGALSEKFGRRSMILLGLVLYFSFPRHPLQPESHHCLHSGFLRRCGQFSH